MDAKTQAICNLLSAQRNQALDALTNAVGQLAEKDEQIAALKAELAALKTDQAVQA